MEYSKVLDELNNASLFELYRLSAAIWLQLEDPKRLKSIKNRLRVGQDISYFNASENRLISAQVIQLKRTRVLVKNKHNGKLWDIPFYQVNIDGTDTDIGGRGKHKLDRSMVKVGDSVCFQDRNGVELFGEVIKLNPKTARVQVGKTKWRVAYGYLSPILDGELGNPNLLEGSFLGEE